MVTSIPEEEPMVMKPYKSIMQSVSNEWWEQNTPPASGTPAALDIRIHLSFMGSTYSNDRNCALIGFRTAAVFSSTKVAKAGNIHKILFKNP